jgi:release factor-specific protein-(glutamine-N5) methyltransferase
MNTKKGNINILIADIAQKIAKDYKDKTLCDQYAWWTVETITGKDQAHLIAQKDFSLTKEQQTKLDDWLDKLINKHMPIQYFIGSVPFDDLDILVEPPVLIPRPETEEWSLDLIKRLKKIKNQDLNIFEPCTGSGCIALAFAKALPEATVYAGDIEEHALELARKNAKHNKIRNITVVTSDVFDGFPRIVKADLIVVNPPYIAESEWKSLDKSVTEWEDKNALVASDKGLGIIEKIIQEAPHRLRANAEFIQYKIPQLMIEIGYKQGEAVMQLMQETGFNEVEIHTDLEGKDRVVSGSMVYELDSAFTQ